jgi:hypothetical protein
MSSNVEAIIKLITMAGIIIGILAVFGNYHINRCTDIIYDLT